MTNTLLGLLLPMVLVSCAAASQDGPATVDGVPQRTFSLFNGKDLTGWKADVPAKDTKPDAPDSFIVRDGMLVSRGGT